MKIVTRSPRQSIFPKIVLTFLALLVPLYTLNLFMTESGSDSVRTEIVRSMNAKVELYHNLIESDFERIIKLVQAYVNDDDLMMLSTAVPVMSEIQKTSAILALKRKLDLVKTSSNFVENASVFIPLLDRIVSSNDNAIAPFDKEQFRALAVTTNRYESPYLMWKDRLFISVPYPDPAISDRREPTFLLAVEVSEKGLRDALRQFANNGELAVLYGNRLPWSIASGGAPAEMADAAEARIAASRLPDDSGRLPLRDGKAEERLDIGGERYLVVTRSSPALDASLSIYMPEEEVFGSLRRYRMWLIALSLASLGILLFFSFSLYRMIQRPLRTLVRSFDKVEQGNLNLIVSYPLKDEFGYLYDRFNAMVKELNVLVHEVYEQQYRVRLAELRHLQSQINPHFLYNSFFLLHRMAALDDRDNIVRFTKFLGEYFQFITRDGMSEVPLETEATHARNYTEIQSFRFASRIRVLFGDIPDGCGGLPVPRLILQPVIENAYHHGLENKAKDGWIGIGFRREDETLVISVEDNGDELTDAALQSLRDRLREPADETESTGLMNVHRRIQIRCGAMYGLELSRSKAGGLRVDIRLPLSRKGNEHVPIADRG